MPDGLDRFLGAQENTYEQALKEIKEGCKYSHWMWFIFPILYGQGRSAMAQKYGIRGKKEAQEYISHPVLGKRLVEISDELLKLEGKTAEDIFGSTDAWKLHCCMTLFREVASEKDTFHMVLDRYYGGSREKRTLKMLERKP